MQACLLDRRADNSIPIVPVAEAAFAGWLARQDESLRRWLSAAGFAAKPGSVCLVPGAGHSVSAVIAGVAAVDDVWALAGLPAVLPEACYHIEADWAPPALERATLGWALGAYQFTR